MHGSSKLVSLIFIFTAIILSNCSDNSIVKPTQNTDYFPTNSNITWKYSTNAATDNENTFVTFEMKIDSTKYPKGKFLALMGKREIDTTWVGIFAIKDSGNVIYSIGDNPPEQPFPLFKHEYETGEAVLEKINILGKEYEAEKIILTFDDNAKISLWFVNGIGLVKEESDKGISVFSDEHSRSNYHIKTELIDFTK